LAFLNAVLKRGGPERLASVAVSENRMLPADVIGGKSSILDVRAELQDGTLVNIELQLKNEGNMDKRSLFYWSRVYAKGIGEGEDYMLLPKVIAINIVNYSFPKSAHYHTCFHLWEDQEKDLLLSDALEIHYINMVEWRKRKRDVSGGPLHWWLAWLDKKNRPELAKEAVKMDSGIAAAQTRLEELLDDEDFIRLYEMREAARIEWTSGINHARREGEQRGMQKGIQKGRAEGRQEGIQEGEQRGMQKGRQDGMQEGIQKVAARMKAAGESAEKIQAFTGLPPEEIEKL